MTSFFLLVSLPALTQNKLSLFTCLLQKSSSFFLSSKCFPQLSQSQSQSSLYCFLKLVFPCQKIWILKRIERWRHQSTLVVFCSFFYIHSLQKKMKKEVILLERNCFRLTQKRQIEILLLVNTILCFQIRALKSNWITNLLWLWRHIRNGIQNCKINGSVLCKPHKYVWDIHFPPY